MIANTKRKALMIGAVSDEFPQSLATQQIGNVFTQYCDELEWLANFLTGDKNVAAACVIDACALAESAKPRFSGVALGMGSRRHHSFCSADSTTTDCSTFFRIHGTRVFIEGTRRCRATQLQL
jgi:hypothetical protein